MEHLPSGTHPLNFKVPYICTEVYDYDGPWISYPAHMKINLSHLRFKAFRYYDRERMGSFFQNWLFFGLLQDILEIKVVTNDFIREDEKGHKFITTAKLPEHMQEWRQKMSGLSTADKLKIYRRHNSIMSEAVMYTRWLTDYPNVNVHQNLEPLMTREAALSLAFLGHALYQASRANLNPDDLSLPLIWASGCLLLEHMEAQGWCPFLVAGFEASLLESKFFAAQIGPPKIKQSHRRCSDDMCVTKALKMQHVEGDCQCCILSPDIEAVVNIIHQDITPLLQFHPSQPDERKESFLEVLQEESETSYVALSHVWKDGLGNEKSNSLSQCQLARIQDTVDSLFGKGPMDLSHPFWMDTLLVPQGNKFKAAKDRTLTRMTEIYKNANKVLVIDSEIVASCSKASSPTDILIRVSLSNWVRRLWTLQEGVFANSIHFLVSDGTVSFASLLQAKLPPHLGDNFKYVFGRCLGQPFFVLNDEKLGSRPSEAQVIYILREVQNRTSTFNKDEALCIALLLDINPKEILEARDSRNPMPILIKALNYSIPPGMLLSPGKRNKEIGFRWAPQSFLVNRVTDVRPLHAHLFEVPAEWPSRALIQRPSGVLDVQGRGLIVMFPGILLGKHLSDEPLSNSQFLIDTSMGATGPEVIEEGKPPLVWRINYSRDKADEPWKYIAPKRDTSESMGVVICSYGPNWRDTAEGILVRLREKPDVGKTSGDAESMLIVRRVCRVLVSGTPEYDNFSWEKAPEKRITGSWRPVTQMWCVD